jgi:outer membrane lipoprotein SlyB
MKTGMTLLVLAAFAAAGCATDSQTARELECAGGVLGGAAVGGLLGNQIGGGTGRQIATAVGAGAGAAAGTQLPACR